MRGWFCAAAPLLLAAAPVTAPIEVTVTDVRSDKGFVRASICTRDVFLKECAWSASVPARKGSVVVTVTGVPPGRYAVQAFHDENGDGKLDTNWIGLPREGIGLSNDAMPRLLPPRFDKAAVAHGDAAQHLPVKLRYFLG